MNDNDYIKNSLANDRTILSIVRTSAIIIGTYIIIKKKCILIFNILLIILSMYSYRNIKKNLDSTVKKSLTHNISYSYNIYLYLSLILCTCIYIYLYH